MKYCSVVFACLLTCSYVFAQKPQLVVPAGHMQPIEQAGFSPGNKLFYTFSSGSNVIKVWETTTAKLLFNLKDTGGFYMQLDDINFSPDSKFIYARTAKSNGDETQDFLGKFSYKLWNAVTGEYHSDIENVYCLGRPFTAGLEYYITHDDNRAVSKVDLATGKEKTLKQYSSNIECYQFDTASNKLIVGTGDVLDIWDLDNDRVISSLKMKPYGRLYHAKSNFNNSLISIIAEKAVVVFDFATGKVVLEVKHKPGTLLKADIDISGEHLMLFGTTGLQRYSLASRKVLPHNLPMDTAGMAMLASRFYGHESPGFYLRYVEYDEMFQHVSMQNLSLLFHLLSIVTKKEEAEEALDILDVPLRASKNGQQVIFPSVNSAITDTGLFVFTRGIPATRSLNRIYGNSLRSEYLIDDVAISATGQYFSYLKERKFGDSLYFDDSLLIYSATERDLVAAFPMGYRQKHFFSNDDSLLLLTDEKGEWTVHDVFRRKQVAGFKNLKFDYLVQMNPAKTEYLLFTSDGKLKVMDFMQNTVLLDTLLAPDPYDELNSDFYKSELETAYADFSGDGKRMIVKLDFYDNQYDNILVYATNPYRLLNTVCDTTLKKTCNLPGNMIINSNGTTIFSVKDNSEIEKTDLRTGKIQVGPGNSGSYEPIVSESFKKSSYSDNKIDENDTRHFSLSSTGKWLYLLNGVSDVERKMSYQLQVFATADLKLHKEYLFLPGTTDISYYLEYLDTANRAIITTEAPMYTIESFSVGDNASGDPEGAILTNNRGDAFYFNLEKRVERAPDSFYNSMSPVFSPDRKLLVTFRGYGYAQVYNWAQGKQLATLEGHDGRLRSFRLSNDKIYGCSKSDDGSFTIWKMPTLSGEKPAELLFRSFQFSNGGFITTDKEGYYICSKNAMEELYFRKNLQTISFSQLDLEYNRPDKVLRSIGCPDTMLVHAYQKAWTKRLASLEIDSSVFSTSHSIPRCAITNAKTVPALQHNKNLVLQISAGDSSALQLFNIRVNEIPVFGSKGIKIQGARHTFDTSVTIQLSEGRNFIEASVMNQFGMESYRSPLVVNYDSDNDSTFTEKKYFIGIGIDRFTQSQYNLRYSAKDIRRLSEELSALGYETLDTLFDEQVTVENIGRLKQKLAHTTVHDKIIIAYSGHGLLDNNYDYYLSTWNVNFDAPEQNGLPYRKLEDLLDGIPSRQKLLLLDACHSGEVDKEEFERIRNVSIQADKKSTIIISPRTKTRVGMKNSIELMQDLFGNGGRNIGATIIAAAGGAQYALERQDLEHGVFTFAFIAALYEGLITINELKAFVSKYVLELSRGVQRPTTRSETSMVNWKL